MNTHAADLYKKHGIDEQYDTQAAYGVGESFYGNGKYPPDWNARREAVWERQQYQCGRCSIYKGDAVLNEVHHIVHLEQGGSNALDNLIGLCADCHALMHPDVDDVRGAIEKSDVFPSGNADDRVSVIRKPRGNDELRVDVERLSEISSPDRNAKAVTDASVPTSATTARRASESLRGLLLEHGFVPRTSSYHRVSVHPRPRNLMAAISQEGVDLSAKGDGEALEVEAVSDEKIDVYFSADTNRSRLQLQHPTGERETAKMQFNASDGERLRVEKPIGAPPLTMANAPQYTIDALQYFGWESLKIGAIPGLVLTFLLSSTIPGGGTIAGALGLALLIGLLIRSPEIYRDATESPTERVVDERKYST